MIRFRKRERWMDLSPWHYFLALERDLVGTTDFVEPHFGNAAAFSNAYAKLLLLVGSEVDVIAKALCRQVPGAAAACNIMDYRSILLGAFPGIETVEIYLARYAMKFTPWQAWSLEKPTSPDWWRAHTNVKHHRKDQFGDANQQHVLNAYAGLLVLELYYYRSVSYLQPSPALYDRGFPEAITDSGHHALPGLQYQDNTGLAHWEIS
jgi:hypothetical protein